MSMDPHNNYANLILHIFKYEGIITYFNVPWIARI